MPGGSSGGNDAAKSAAGFDGLESVTAPLTGEGTTASPLAMPAATNAAAGHMTSAHVLALEGAGDAYSAQDTLGAAGQFLTFDGLDGNAHGVYELTCDIACAAGEVSIQLQYDGGAWGAPAHVYVFTNEDLATPGSAAVSALVSTTASTRIGLRLLMFARTLQSTERLGIFSVVASAAAAGIDASTLHGHLRSTNTTGNLTGIRIAGNGASNLRAGSRGRIRSVPT